MANYNRYIKITGNKINAKNVFELSQNIRMSLKLIEASDPCH